MTRTVEVQITGRVQGVGFRWWTAEQARALALAGWVRNEPDGSVRAVFHGPAEAVTEMLKRCGNGPTHASVTGVTKKTDGIAPPDPCNGFTMVR